MEEDVTSLENLTLIEGKKYWKYARTFHIPHSHGTRDDKKLANDFIFHGKIVSVAEKKDGESFGGYNDFCHARSLDSDNHLSRNFAKALWFQRAHLLDDNMKVCCENMYAQHTIHYKHLDSYLYIISVWIDDLCLSQEECEEYAEILELPIMPVFYKGVYDLEKIEQAYKEYKAKSLDPVEGYVIRIADEFKLKDFSKSVAKFVEPKFREDLENCDGHWMFKEIIKNDLNKFFI